MAIRLALKVDVDTDRGTRIGVPNLVNDLNEFNVPACFLFSLGPDQTGRAPIRHLNDAASTFAQTSPFFTRKVAPARL